MDLRHLTRIKEEKLTAIKKCEEKIQKWKEFKANYETLKDRLTILPDSLSYDVTVPFGKNGFVLGQIVHTNEITVNLGDNWFVDVSAKQGVAIAERRVAQLGEELQKLEREKTLHEDWLNQIKNTEPLENLVDICEEYDEEEEKKWREQHAKNVKAYRQKLAEEKKSQTKSAPAEDLIDLLESMELTSTTHDSDSKSTPESDGSNFDYSDDNIQVSDEVNAKTHSLKLNIPSVLDDENEDGEDEEGADSEEPDPSEECSSPSNEKHVRWQDLSKHKFRRITIRHSRNKKQLVKHQDSSESDDTIRSPSDIYKLFGDFMQASPPKSILKIKNSPPPASPESYNEFFPPTPQMIIPEKIEETEPLAFTGEVVERSSPMRISEKKSARPSSQFKNSRKNRRR